MKFFITYLTALILIACNPKKEAAQEGNAVVMMPAKTLSVKGDFLGDGYKYTLNAAVTNHSGSAITKIPDPHETEWDSIISYYNKYHLQVRVAINEIKGVDELVFDNAQGLYCLINLGDMNGDKRDDIALVTDYFDYTNISTCVIYSYCNDKWTALATFRIPEDVFSWDANEPEPVFNDIAGYLQKQDGRWMFLDYETAFNSDEEHVPMQPLKVSKCERP